MNMKTVLLLAAIGTLPGCAALRQTAADVVIREPGHRALGAPQPAQPEAQKDLEFAWLSESAYGKTSAGRKQKQKETPATLEADAPCPDSEPALLAAGWTRW